MELATTGTFLPEERLLIRELTHRINNEFTCAANMVSLAAARATSSEVKAALTEVMKRLEGYAGVHRALRMPDVRTRVDASGYFRELCQSIRRSRLDRRNIDLVFVERPLFLEAEQCWLLGMIVYELISNAARHAFNEAGGEIRVNIVQAGGFIECHVEDNGSAPFFARRGHGLKIVEELSASLGGVFNRRFRQSGSAWAVVFPAS
jgi:two-component sensor histidine kinase